MTEIWPATARAHLKAECIGSFRVEVFSVIVYLLYPPIRLPHSAGRGESVKGCSLCWSWLWHCCGGGILFDRSEKAAYNILRSGRVIVGAHYKPAYNIQHSDG